jgi:hypothetical protein
MNIDIQINDVRAKIATVKENRNNHFRHPMHILAILSLREMQLEDQLYFMKSK